MAQVIEETSLLGEKYHFLIRRLHSLTGIVPVGAFLCVHMLLNGAMIAGGDAYQNGVNLVHSLDKVGILKLVEVLFIFIPIAFHAVFGVVIWLTSQPNYQTYRYIGNWRYTLQRWTAWITLVFILVHLWHMHWLGAWLGGNWFDPHFAPVSAIEALDGWLWGPLYAIGVIAAVYHFANGIWTFLIVWGITIGPQSQKISSAVCLGIGIILGLLGLGSLCVLKTTDPATLTAPAEQDDQVTTFDNRTNPSG